MTSTPSGGLEHEPLRLDVHTRLDVGELRRDQGFTLLALGHADRLHHDPGVLVIVELAALLGDAGGGLLGAASRT